MCLTACSESGCLNADWSADPCPASEAPREGIWASDLDHEAITEAWSDFISIIWQFCVHRLPEEKLVPGCTFCRRLASRSSVGLWAMFNWEILSCGIHVDVTLTRTTYQNIPPWQQYYLMPVSFFYIELYNCPKVFIHNLLNLKKLQHSYKKQLFDIS